MQYVREVRIRLRARKWRRRRDATAERALCMRRHFRGSRSGCVALGGCSLARGRGGGGTSIVSSSQSADRGHRGGARVT